VALFVYSTSRTFSASPDDLAEFTLCFVHPSARSSLAVPRV